jgi:hypothetical protein
MQASVASSTSGVGATGPRRTIRPTPAKPTTQPSQLARGERVFLHPGGGQRAEHHHRAVEQRAVTGRQAQRRPGIEQKRHRHRQRAQAKQLHPMPPRPSLFQRRHDECQRDRGQADAPHRQHIGPEHRAGHAQEQEGSAPQGRQRNQLHEVTGFHRRDCRASAPGVPDKGETGGKG